MWTKLFSFITNNKVWVIISVAVIILSGLVAWIYGLYRDVQFYEARSHYQEAVSRIDNTMGYLQTEMSRIAEIGAVNEYFKNELEKHNEAILAIEDNFSVIKDKIATINWDIVYNIDPPKNPGEMCLCPCKEE